MTETPEPSAPTAARSSIGTWLFFLAALAFAVLMYAWVWLDAWVRFPDLETKDRMASFKTALERDGVAARLENGPMTILRAADVAEVGTSRCERDSACSQSGRRGCREVGVTFTCMYRVKTRDGRAATALVEVLSNPDYQLGVTARGSAAPFSVQPRLQANAADQKLCRLAGTCPRN
jgi:hypothetical protein